MKYFLLILFSVLQLAAQQVDVIVVGAGISGIAAAKKLHEKGLSVLVIEAKDHIGGRTYTSSFDSHPEIAVDMGAAWIQEVKKNPLIKLAEEYGAPHKYFDYDKIDRFDMTYPLKSPPLSPMDNDLFDDLYDEIESKIAKARDKGKEMSLQEALNPWLSSLSPHKKAEVLYMLTSELEQEYGCDISDLSLLHFDDDDAFKGGDHLMVQGYGPIIHGLSQKLVQENLIHLNEVAREIHYGDDTYVVTDKDTYEATYIICTVPLGVLQRDNLQFFPPLPGYKRESIGKIHMGILDKTVLLFPYVFWNESQTLIDRVPQEKGFWIETVNYAPFNGQPMLVAFNSGSEAKELIETKTDAEIVESVMTVLREIYGANIPEPISYINTRWGIDPHTHGSFSHLPTGATMDDFANLAKPVENLHFAGEATSSFFGTAHGAYMSGVREADSIAKKISE